MGKKKRRSGVRKNSASEKRWGPQWRGRIQRKRGICDKKKPTRFRKNQRFQAEGYSSNERIPEAAYIVLEEGGLPKGGRLQKL